MSEWPDQKALDATVRAIGHINEQEAENGLRAAVKASPVIPVGNEARCQKCEGTGRYRDPRYWGTMPGSTVCPDCQGTGHERVTDDAMTESFNHRGAERVIPYPENVPPATPEQATAAMQESMVRASFPPDVLDAITDPRVGLPGDPLADDAIIPDRASEFAARNAEHHERVEAIDAIPRVPERVIPATDRDLTAAEFAVRVDQFLLRLGYTADTSLDEVAEELERLRRLDEYTAKAPTEGDWDVQGAIMERHREAPSGGER